MSFIPLPVVSGSGGTHVEVTSRLSATITGNDIVIGLPYLGTPGSYNSVSVDSWGRVTLGERVADGSSGGTEVRVTSRVSAAFAASLVTLDLTTTGVTPGSYTSVTVDAYGRVTAGSAAPSSGGTEVRVTSRVSAAFAASLVTIDLATTGVTAGGSYNSLTVDAYGRVTNAQTVAGGSGNSLLWTSALSGQVTGSTVTLDLSATGVTAGSSYNSLTVDARGRVTNAQTVASGGPTYSQTSLSADTGRGSLTLADSLLSLPLTSGKLYKWDGFLIFRTQATTTGLRFGATVPAFTVLAGTGEVPVAAGGTGGVYHSYLTASGVSITGTGVALAGVNYLARFYGTIQPSSDGTLVVQFASEINASRVSLMAGSHVGLWQLT